MTRDAYQSSRDAYQSSYHNQPDGGYASYDYDGNLNARHDFYGDYGYNVRSGYGGCQVSSGLPYNMDASSLLLGILVAGALVTYILYRAITTNITGRRGLQGTADNILNFFLSGKINP